MKRFLSLIAVVLLVTLPVVSQDSDPATVNFTFQYEAGIVLTLSETAVDFGLIPLLTDPVLEEDFYPAPAPVEMVISFKLAAGQQAQLVCETSGDFMYNSTPKKPADYMHHEISGEFTVGEAALPDPEDSQVIMWSSGIAGGKVTGDLLYKVWRHKEFGGTEYPFLGAATYTVLDVVI